MKNIYNSSPRIFDDPFDDDDYFSVELRRCRRRTRLLRFFKHTLLCLAIFTAVCLLVSRG